MIEETDTQKPSREAVDPASAGSGVGWKWDAETRSLTFYFDAYEEECGIKVTHSECRRQMPRDELEGFIRRIEEKGFQGIKVRAITPEVYEELGYE